MSYYLAVTGPSDYEEPEPEIVKGFPTSDAAYDHLVGMVRARLVGIVRERLVSDNGKKEQEEKIAALPPDEVLDRYDQASDNFFWIITDKVSDAP